MAERNYEYQHRQLKNTRGGKQGKLSLYNVFVIFRYCRLAQFSSKARINGSLLINNNKARPQHQELIFPLFMSSARVLQHPKLTSTEKMRETGSTSYHPYPRKLECLTICRCLLCYFKTLSVGLVWNLNPEPLTPQLVLYVISLPSVVKISFLELCN